jgi:uncharacterized protein YjiS (DUF1127 family)
MAADTIGMNGFAAWLKELNAKRIERAQIKRTIKELSALDDRALWDMGMSRGDIYSVAHGTSDLRRVRENANLKGWV